MKDNLQTISKNNIKVQYQGHQKTILSIPYGVKVNSNIHAI